MNQREEKPNDWIYGIWFIGGDDQDWLGTLLKADGKWRFEYRFRYHNPASKDPFDGKDKKSWFTAIMKDDCQKSFNEALKAIRELIPVIEDQFAAQADFVDLQCQRADPKFFFELTSRPWANVKRIPK